MFTHIISSSAATATAVTPRAIERMHAEARAPLLAHFLALSAADRRLRFGRPIAESVIATYVDGIDFTRDTILGVRDDQSQVIGVAHMAFDGDSAEVGLSVAARIPQARHRQRAVRQRRGTRALLRARDLHAVPGDQRADPAHRPALRHGRALYAAAMPKPGSTSGPSPRRRSVQVPRGEEFA